MSFDWWTKLKYPEEAPETQGEYAAPTLACYPTWSRGGIWWEPQSRRCKADRTTTEPPYPPATLYLNFFTKNVLMIFYYLGNAKAAFLQSHLQNGLHV